MTDTEDAIESGSEFGAGIVVCLAKFSEHLQSHGPYNEHAIRLYAEATQEDWASWQYEAQCFPFGDASARLSELSVIEAIEATGPDRSMRSKEETISHAIEMWANGASDHFYDLDEKAPEPLKELASLALMMGHGFTGRTWTIADLDRIRQLWQESCLAVDQMLGIENPDWGSW